MAKHKFPKMLKESPKTGVLLRDMSSEEYHSTEDTYSSSQFKDLLDDEDIFIQKYILKTIPREVIPAFDVGSYFHTGILEPHKLSQDCVVFEGKVRRGSAWDKFKSENEGRTIVSQSQVDSAEKLIEAVQNSPVAMHYIKRAEPEVSLFQKIKVYQGLIYASQYGKMLDKRLGWISAEVPKQGVEFVVKVRADSLGDLFILDLKSTTGNAKSASSMGEKIKYYNYDLSASLYLDMFSLVKGKQLNTFIWTFASKDFGNAKSYRASDDNILVGRAKYMGALLKLAYLIENGWQTYDSLGVLEPSYSELHYLKEKETDLI